MAKLKTIRRRIGGREKEEAKKGVEEYVIVCIIATS